VGWDLFEYDGASGNTCHDLLRNLALLTGGRFFYAPTAAELDGLYRQISAEMRGSTRYRLLAHWEVVEQHMELVSARPVEAKTRPAIGGIPPALPDLTEQKSSLFSKPKPFQAGIPPALAELQSVPLMPLTFGPSRFAIPAQMDLAAMPNHTRTPSAAISALPAVPELAVARLPTPSAQPQPLDPLPEFGRLAVTYKPGADNTPLPISVRPALEIILDCSGSMDDEVAGMKKYLAARRVLTDVLKVLPDDAMVGFRVFGRMAFWDPNKEAMPALTDKRYDIDTEVIIRIEPLSKERRKEFQDWIDYLTPKGETPLVYSLLQARKDFPQAWKGPKTVLLISDGMESRGGKLTDVEKAYATDDVGLIIHVVGFDVQVEKEQEFLKAVARIGRGQFFNVKNAKQLGDAVAKSLQAAAFEIIDDRGKLAGTGLVNGPALELEAGSFTLRFPATKLEPLRIRVAGGKVLPILLTHDGKLTLLAP
ncbi:MAG TPA: hypothetical protein VGZ47_18140, partial [Gemmataceae bacterium]|nr:hypothetical protein [Gemmataceae bacterium]